MKRFLKIGGGLCALLMLCAALFAAHLIWFKPLKIRWFFDRTFVAYAISDPEMLTSLGMLERIGIRRHNARLSDASMERADAMMEKLKRDLAMLRSYDRDKLSESDQLSYDILEYFLAVQAEGERFRWHNYPVNQLFGVQNSLPSFMASQHPLTREIDAEHYLSRLEQFPVKFGQVLEGLEHRRQLGIHPPRFVIDRVLVEMSDFINTPPRENILYTHLAERLEAIDGEHRIDEADRTRLLEDVERALVVSVYPAYQQFIAHFESLADEITESHGVWALPDGDALYRHAIRSNTTTQLDPEVIHQIGLDEVARIEQEMLSILEAAGYVEGTLAERMDALTDDPSQQYSEDDAGREQILLDYQSMIDEIDLAMDDYFDVRPKVGVEVKRIPEFRERTAPGAYYQRPSMDGSRPGVFFANLRSVREIPRFSMRTLAYHEGVPGHHFQIAIMQELQDVPMFRRMLPFTAYTEGWALYTEQLAWEIGFQNDPLDNLGRLQAEIFRAVRLVVDTGLHHKRWTREQAIEYMLAKTGMGINDVTAEIERYMVRPGQALAYKVGMLKILELRERAREQLGDRFDIKDFHNVVLTNGAVPLEILERLVDQYIEEQRST